MQASIPRQKLAFPFVAMNNNNNNNKKKKKKKKKLWITALR
jgi:hypothetical protein